MADLPTPAPDDVDPRDAQEVLARFGAEEIIATGSLLYPGLEKPTLFPFKDDRTYGIILDIRLSKEPVETISRLIIERDIGVTVSVLRTRGFGLPSIHYNLIVAISEKHQYSMTIAVNIIGGPEDFWLNVQYNIVRLPLS